MTARNKLVATTIAITICAAGAGCGGSAKSPSSADPKAAEVSPPGDIPDNQAYVAYQPPGAGFSVKVPEGWSRRRIGSAVLFTDKLNSIRMQTHAAPGASSIASARRTDIPALTRSVAGLSHPTIKAVQRHSGQAIRITYDAPAAPDKVTGRRRSDAVERYAFFHGGHEVVLTLAGPRGADNVDPWRIVTDSLRYKR